MVNSLILDYIGVIADVDIKKMLKNLTISEKFKALRILAGMKKNPIFKETFDGYQNGSISHDELCMIAAGVYPKAAMVVPKLLELIPVCLKENKPLLKLVKKLHDDGVKIVLLSNSIPETQMKIENSKMVEDFDGFVLSHLVQMMKPNKEIYDFTCETYGLVPENTLFVDDTYENIVGAEQSKLKTMHCTDMRNIASRLGRMFYSEYQQEPNE